ncbi:MAG: DNA replication/repair protein RecF [Chloroflexi bacterium]|nr:DNA replication/repair protein RecF [Chloroflexota bacterium]MCH7984924.1 DNA replication/repair protein RecF [Chloroflexota bacterium]MCH8113916.1 DNA replication/repair protein RecF [Chloroflexota bacterium]MCI0775415.1 DNA replication/repair protein RecF [Chloroflexota bacterium]MCI0803903.1 DNA replication/repair protein RecF [Chloroflexota bacterium]
MYLSRLSLTGFRNHTNTDLELRPGLTLFQGNNGQGKSNLLEAAYMLAIAKTPRSSNESELVNWSLAETGGHMQVLGVGREGDTTIQAQIDVDITAPTGSSPRGLPGFRKGLRVNGIKRSAIDFVGNLNVVFFEADDLEIVHGPPGRRRRYLDILISQSDPAYLKSLQRYGQVVSQRNQLLRRIRDGVAGENELTFWDERLAYEGARVTDSRRRAVDGLNEHAVPAHSDLADGDRLELEYQPRITASSGAPGGARSKDTPDIGAMNAETIEQEIARALATVRRREIAQGVTVVGPHRDDLKIFLNGYPAGQFASRGQSRTIALSLKLAEAVFVNRSTGRTPILALDDILSELDPERQRRVLEAASKHEQVLLTATEPGVVPSEFLEKADIYTVMNGRVTQDAIASASS